MWATLTSLAVVGVIGAAIFCAFRAAAMRALIAEQQVEARLRRRAMDDDAPRSVSSEMETANA